MLSENKQVASGTPLALPALRGRFGDWTYYSTVVPMPELARRVSFADDIHTNLALSTWIQRSLKEGRAAEIADYLKREPERFFNSLVVALYGGMPEWVPLALPDGGAGGPDLGEAADVLGVLHLSGTEKLFAVDGQHRLAGMKRFMKNGEAPNACNDLVSILVVAHRVDRKVRTRRLFTTLNKTAVPVSKMERIALDENDVMAITARHLVEEHKWFQSPRVAMHHTNNLGRDEGVALTTIGNLYDVLRILYLAAPNAKKRELEFVRPLDDKLDAYYKEAESFFKTLSKIEPELARYFAAEEPNEVCREVRTDAGGSVYFRPIGLALMTKVAITLREEKGAEWKDWMTSLPKKLEEAPFSGTIWSHRGTIEPKNRVLCRDILYYMCGIGQSSAASLRERLQLVTGDANVSIPRRMRV